MKFAVLVIILLTTLSVFSLEIGTVQVISGKCEVLRASAENWEPVNQKAQIFVNDQVRTEKGTKAKFIYNQDKTLLALRDGSQITFQEYSLMIQRGALMIQVQKKGSKFEVKTPTAVAGIRGTLFEMDVMPDGASEVFVYNGMVHVADPRDKDNAVLLSAGKCCKSSARSKSLFGNLKKKKLKAKDFKMDQRRKKFKGILTAKLDTPRIEIPQNEEPKLVEEPELVDEPTLIVADKEDEEEEIDENAVIKGDLDKDGKISLKDVRCMKSFLSKIDLQNNKVKEEDKSNYIKCDMNNDSVVDNMDLLILRALVRKPDGTLMVKDRSGEELRKQYKAGFIGTEED